MSMQTNRQIKIINGYYDYCETVTQNITVNNEKRKGK